METKVEDINSWKKSLTIKKPASEINDKVKAKVREYAKTMSVPGFRKGKVPVAFVEKKYGPSIEAEVVEGEIDVCYRAALKENDIQAITYLPIEEDAMKYDKENGLEFTIVVEVEPEIEIKNYTDHGVKVPGVKITQKKIDEKVASILDSKGEYVDSTKEVIEEGMWAVVDYKSTEEDELKEDYRLNIVKDDKGEMDDFVASLVGKKIGDEYTVDYMFGKDVSEDLAGNTITFEVKVKKAEEKKAAELTPELIKELGHEDEEAMRASVKDGLRKEAELEAENKAYDQVMDKLLAENEVPAPDSAINNYLKNKFEQMKQYYGMTDEMFGHYAEENKESAAVEVKKYYILKNISDKEDIKVSSEDVDEKIKELAGMYNMTFEDLKKSMRSKGETIQVREELKIDKTVKFLLGK